ncbi:MAG: DUF615 domain-containing protein [Zoogloeaceae bacterium]|jgi:ribosome-associated protein|nr:DUF615 domain-containing protein [Zoogloeaceae bacterium]
MSASRFSPARVEEDHAERLSKTQQKAAMQALQDLGEALTRLSRERLQKLALPEDYADLREAVLEYQRIPKFEARRRQLQYIGRLMRGLDAAPLRSALADAQGDSAGEIARLHRLETLRETFLADETAGIRRIVEQWPQADLTRLRQLRRSALKEQAEGKPPRQFRALFQTLKALETASEAAVETMPDDSPC